MKNEIREALLGIGIFVGSILCLFVGLSLLSNVQAQTIVTKTGGGSSSTATPAPTPTVVPVFTGQTTFGSAQGAANSIDFNETAGCMTIEGATADAFESRLCAVDPTVGDQVFNFPNLAGATTDTLVTLGATQILTAKTLTSPLIGTSLLPTGTGTPLGTTTTPFSNIVLHLSGTYGTGSYTFAGTPNANYVITFPGNQNATLAGQNIANAFTSAGGNTVTNASYFNFNQDAPLLLGGDTSTSYDRIAETSALTPDGLEIRVGSLSNSLHILETGDGAFDFNNGNCGTSTCTDPSLWIFSHNQNTAQWGGFWHNATDFAIGTGTGGLDITAVPGTFKILRTITAGGTTGAQTINKPAGTINIAAGQTSIVVTDSLVTTTSIVFAVIRTNDSTATIKNVVSASGSFTVTITAAATAETSIGFWVTN